MQVLIGKILLHSYFAIITEHTRQLFGRVLTTLLKRTADHLRQARTDGTPRGSQGHCLHSHGEDFNSLSFSPYQRLVNFLCVFYLQLNSNSEPHTYDHPPSLILRTWFTFLSLYTT